ncbi:hypothetical protein ACOXVJ_27575 [Pseudomonas knackmussii]|uniref:hypothetical protein n=1 Tax=Pseudomonas knackmussii TaxID=65741 RepID=UPI003BE7AAB6
MNEQVAQNLKAAQEALWFLDPFGPLMPVYFLIGFGFWLWLLVSLDGKGTDSDRPGAGRVDK